MMRIAVPQTVWWAARILAVLLAVMSPLAFAAMGTVAARRAVTF